jgi:ABC-type multidrug transport system fused ATPase/permease subunit
VLIFFLALYFVRFYWYGFLCRDRNQIPRLGLRRVLSGLSCLSSPACLVSSEFCKTLRSSPRPLAVLWWAGRARTVGKIRITDNEASKLMTDHIPASLHFSSLSYTLNNNNRIILDSISGCVKPGQVLAIMGASGALPSSISSLGNASAWL